MTLKDRIFSVISVNKGCHSLQQLAAPREGELVSPEGTQERIQALAQVLLCVVSMKDVY